MATPVGITAETASEIKANLKQLETSAHALNKLSDELTKKVAEVEDAINRLNLGISAHVDIQYWGSEDGLESSAWRLAYGKESGKWGFVIEYVSENLNWPDAGKHESWLFKDSPREKRIRAVEKIPELIGALVKKSNEVAEEIGRKVSYTQSIAATLPLAKPEGINK